MPTSVLSFLLVSLSLQVGLQPFFARWGSAAVPSKVSLVFACEFCKLGLAALFFLFSSSRAAAAKWTLRESLCVAGLPAVLYAAQNVLLQISYANCGATTFQLVNQTKVFWSVLFIYLFLGLKQTAIQCVSLAMLVTSGFLAGRGADKRGGGGGSDGWGVLCGTLAAVVSGLASTLCQRALQGQDRNPFLFGGELSVYSLCALTASRLIAMQSPIPQFAGWTWLTPLPVVSLAVGGMLTGFVTKYGGNVPKGYSSVAGILITGFIDAVAGARGVRAPRLWIALVLCVGSILLRTKK
jgi:UDP-sugar transporter A1/2/3